MKSVHFIISLVSQSSISCSISDYSSLEYSVSELLAKGSDSSAGSLVDALVGASSTAESELAKDHQVVRSPCILDLTI